MDEALEKEALGICPHLNPSGKSKRVLEAFYGVRKATKRQRI